MEPFGIIGGVVVAAKLLGKQVAECGRQFGMTPCGTGRLFAFGKRLGKQCRHGKGQMAQGQPPKGGSGIGSAAFEQLPEQLQFPAVGCRKSYGCGVSGPLFEPEPQLTRHTGGIDEEQQRIERLATEKGMHLPGQYGHRLARPAAPFAEIDAEEAFALLDHPEKPVIVAMRTAQRLDRNAGPETLEKDAGIGKIGDAVFGKSGAGHDVELSQRCTGIAVQR